MPTCPKCLKQLCTCLKKKVKRQATTASDFGPGQSKKQPSKKSQTISKKAQSEYIIPLKNTSLLVGSIAPATSTMATADTVDTSAGNTIPSDLKSDDVFGQKSGLVTPSIPSKVNSADGFGNKSKGSLQTDNFSSKKGNNYPFQKFGSKAKAGVVVRKNAVTITDRTVAPTVKTLLESGKTSLLGMTGKGSKFEQDDG